MRDVAAAFEPDVRELDFGKALVGGKAVRTVLLTNTGRGTALVRARAQPPFTVAPEVLTLTAGGAAQVSVSALDE